MLRIFSSAQLRSGLLAFYLVLLYLTGFSQSGTFQLAADISPGGADAEVGELFEFGGKLYFKANDGAHGSELWKFDGTSASLAADIDVTTSTGSDPNSFIEFNGKLYFQADDHNTYGNELWSFDGITASLAADINSGGSSDPSDFVVFNGNLFFSADSGSGRELWQFDGTTASSLALPVSDPADLVVYNGNLYFSGYFAPEGREVWYYDGSAGYLISFRSGTAGSDPQWLTIYNSNLYLTADDGTNGRELWKHNGVTSSLAGNINPAGGSSDPEYLTVFNNKLFFSATDGGGSVELFLFDGIAISKADSGSSVLNPKYFGIYNNNLFFSATAPSVGEELAVFDGDTILPAGDLYSGATGSYPLQKLEFNGRLYFAANDGIKGPNELWAYFEGGNYWTGNINTDWFTAGNWSSNLVPASADSVVIPDVGGTTNRFPEINGPSAAEVKDIYIASNASLTITTVNGAKLNVYGNIYNYGAVSLGPGSVSFKGISQSIYGSVSVGGIVAIEAGSTLNTNGNLTIESGGSLLHGAGTPGGEGSISNHPVTVKRTGYSSSNLWNYWSSPVSGPNVNILGSNLYYYNPNAATGSGSLQALQAGWKPASGVMSLGKGYISKGGGTVSFSGTLDNLNSGPVLKLPVTKNAANGVGYNLIGNPFPSAMSAQKFMEANGPSGPPFFGNDSLFGSMYFWDDPGTGIGYSQGDFAVWSGAGGISGPNTSRTPNGYVATGQGFFVEKMSNGTSTISFDNGMRSGQNNVFFRQAPIDRLRLNVRTSNNLYNEILIAFIDDATDGFDPGYDAKKMRGNPNLALYTKLNGMDYAIQAFSELTDDKVIELGLDAGLPGTYTLGLKNIENMDETVELILEDRWVNTFQYLRLQPDYNFIINATGTQAERFYLHFTPPMQIETRDESCVGADGQIIMEQNGSVKWSLLLINASGDIVAAKSSFNGQLVINNLSAGTYSLALVDVHGYRVSKTITVKGNQQVQANFSASALQIVEGSNVSFTNLSAGATQYEWDFGDGTAISGLENPDHTYLNGGTYLVTLQISNGICFDEFQQEVRVIALATLSGEQTESRVSIILSNKVLYIDFSRELEPGTEMEIYDILGKELLRKEIHQQKFTVDVNSLSGDFFVIKITLSGKSIVKEVFVP